MQASINSLPLDTLVQILCKLEHNELKRLPLISKSFHNAVLVARQLHFDFATPVPTKLMAFSGLTTVGILRSPMLNLECRKPPRKPMVLSEEETRKIAVVLFPARDCSKELIPEERWDKNSMDLSVQVPGANAWSLH